ncbi:hypothetical protein JZ751_007658 [Albula glossodonta]|uniref:Aconitate hydratase n=1 Tax=Albula glossodonta TaxID=121402 RepID=A0A8T2N4Y1_9TELE|nr:hypothetical protein JZ751_007658 [Albula glossodonta]
MSLECCAVRVSSVQVVELDLGTVVPCCSGPKRPQDKVAISKMKEDFEACLEAKQGFKGFQVVRENLTTSKSFQYNGAEYSLSHGSVAVKARLSVKPYIKTSLSPGSGVVTYYLKESGVMSYLSQLGFEVVGYGCMTCIGNSGPLPESVVEAITQGDLVAAGVLSGNRNFEGRVHPNTRANYLASPPLVIAYAIAGTIRIDFEKEPLAVNAEGKEVFLRDIWPTREEIQAVERQHVIPAMFKEVYEKIETMELKPPKSITDAYVLLNLGDSVTTDHISPAGNIARNSPAARYLSNVKGVNPRDFNSYGSRRGNDAVMARGTFANIRLFNKFLNKQAPRTIHLPSEETGIKAVLAESYERIHRSNLVGMGIIPLEYLPGETADSLGLTGRERYTITIPDPLTPRMIIDIKLDSGKSFQARMRFDTDVELTYFHHGGILNYMIRKMSGK